MSDCMVKHICQKWIDVGLADECFWEGWPECPTPQDGLTPRMVLYRIEELETKLAKAVEAFEYIESMTVHSGGEIHWVTAIQWKLAFDEAQDVTRETLAELTGGKDE